MRNSYVSAKPNSLAHLLYCSTALNEIICSYPPILTAQEPTVALLFTFLMASCKTHELLCC